MIHHLPPFRRLIFLATLATSLLPAFFCLEAAAQPSPISRTSTPTHTASNPPRLGLALAGGGALGFAHVGVLKVLHEARVPVSIAAGTSMGSIVGAAYASGATLEEIEQILTTTDWDRLFSDGPTRQDLPNKDKTGRNRELLGDGKFGVIEGKVVLPAGILQGQKIRPVLQRLFYRYPVACSFDSFPVTYRAIAADIESGKAVIIDKGDLALATRASMAVPGVFAPVEIDSKLLVDGGVANNLPIDVVQSLGASHVIAVELYADLQKRDQLTNPFAISGQMLSLLLAQNAAIQRSRLGKKDLLIEPDLKGYTATSFNKASELVARGEAAARAKLAELQRFSLSESEYARFEARRTKIPPTETIRFVRVVNDSSIPTEVIQEKVSVKVGDQFNSERVQESVDRIYNLGAFSSVSNTQVYQDGEPGLQITAEKKPWYEQYFRVGLGLEEDLEGDSFYNFAAGLRTNDFGFNGGFLDSTIRLGRVNSLAAEYQDPFAEGSNYFYALEGFTDRRSLFVRNTDDLVAEYRRERTQGGIGVGYGFYESYDAKLGVRRGFGDITRRVGSPELPETDFDVGDLLATFSYDTLDDVDFPREGSFIEAGISRTLDAIGGSGNFTELSGQVTQPINIGFTNLIYRGEFSFTDGERPIGRAFTLGGFLDLSGYTQNSLLATSYQVNRLMILEPINEGSSLLGYKLFAGASVELSSLLSSNAGVNDGGVISSGSIFLGANTPLLPIYVGVGGAEGGNYSFYLVVGRATSGAQRLGGG